MTLGTSMTAYFLQLLLPQIVHMVVYTFSYVNHFAMRKFSKYLGFSLIACLIAYRWFQLKKLLDVNFLLCLIA